METKVKVEEWLRKMGYDSDIPSSLSKICNPSTAFIWEQLITNIRPRQEVEVVKKNIIFNRLAKEPLSEQDQFDYPIKEIKVYVDKKKSEEKIVNLENAIEEKEIQIDELLNKNKMTFVTIDNLKARIREIRNKKFALEEKSKMLEEEINQGKEVITLARNLTPVELDQGSNSDEITKTLQKCAEKLQKLSEVQHSKVTRNKSSFIKFAKMPKKSHKTSVFSKYLEASILNSSTKIPSHSNKENLGVNRCLKFTNEKQTKPKRDSLGLLPNNCLDTSDDFDDFLLNSRSDNTETIPESDCDIVTKLQNDRDVQKDLKDLLYNNNRSLILTQCKNVFNNLVAESKVPIMEFKKYKRSDQSVNHADLTELYFIHVKSELEKEKIKIKLKKLKETATKRNEEILSQISTKRNRDEIRAIFELQKDDVYHTTVVKVLENEIKSLKKFEKMDDLHMKNLKIKQITEEIFSKIESIQELIPKINGVISDIKTNIEETSICVMHLYPYFSDLSWASALTLEGNFKEIETFKNFPLEFNRQFTFTKLSVPHRDISDTTVPSFIKLDPNNLKMITTLIDLPFSLAENVVLDTLKNKITLHSLKELPELSSDLNCKKYSLEELIKQEEYVKRIENSLSSVISSASAKQENTYKMYKIMDWWLEMPFRNYISPKRLVDGQEYKFYERKLKELVKEN